MSTAQIRCKDCGKPLNRDEQQNFFSFCYDCFKDYRSSKMRKGTAMRVIGLIGVVFVSMVIFMYSAPVYGSERPLRVPALIIGSIVAELIPVLLIIFGTRIKRKWSTIFKAKPIEPQRVISTPAINTISAQKEFCPECGNKISDQNQKFCVNCGTEIQNI